MEKPFDPLEYEKLGYWKMFDEFSSRNRTEIVEKMSNNEEKKKTKSHKPAFTDSNVSLPFGFL